MKHQTEFEEFFAILQPRKRVFAISRSRSVSRNIERFIHEVANCYRVNGENKSSRDFSRRDGWGIKVNVGSTAYTVADQVEWGANR